MKILITGADGQLGRCLQDKLQETDYEVVALSRKSLDITDNAAVKDVFEQHKPDVVINAAAYTAVDKAESEPELAFAINETGPKNLAIECNKYHIPLIHISTDYVFDGTKTTPYLETDDKNPQTVYGKSKLAGERAIQKYSDKYSIIRTSWVFSEYGNNFLKTMLRLAVERDEINIVSDKFGGATYAGDLASAIIGLIPVVTNKEYAFDILHYSGIETCSWFEFAKEIISQAQQLGMVKENITLKAILSDDYKTLAPRPQYSVLDCTLYEYKYAVLLSNWRISITRVLEKLKLTTIY